MRAVGVSGRGSWVMSVLVGCLVAMGCSTNNSGLGDAGHSGAGTGGAVAAGGKGGGSASGGATGTGGSVAAGGKGGHVGSGGAIASGGAGGTSSGGAAAMGGTVGGGGKGGTPGSGGAGGASSGGTGGKGGGPGSGGASGQGGKAGSGGLGGKGGAPGSGGGGGMLAGAPECTTAADCELYDNCCVCQAQSVSAEPPACAITTCIVARCTVEQLPQGQVSCTAGRCVAGFNCDASKVTCKVAVPNCDPGEVPAVNTAGSCYNGGCVPATQCKSVTGCASCGPGQACVIYQYQMGPETHCVTPPTSCKGGIGMCDCLGPSVCTGSFRSCGNLSGQMGIVCSCPNC